MTMTDPTTEAQRRSEADRQFLADKPALPDAATLARPLVKALRDIYDAFEDRADVMEFAYDNGDEYEAEVDQLLDTAAVIVTITRSAVRSMMAGNDVNSALPALVDPVLRGIMNVDGLELLRVNHRHSDAFWTYND